MARPTKLNPETQAKLVQAIQMGATYELAAQYAGITYNSFNNWMKEGESAKSGIYLELFQAVKEAEGRAAVGWLVKIEKAASDGSWQAAAWKLERRYPQTYGKTAMDVTSNGETLTAPTVFLPAIANDDSDG